MLDEKSIEMFKKAGKITAKIREHSKKMIMISQSILDIAESIEKMILEEGAKPAFPINISTNEVAAHATPALDSKDVLGGRDIVKIDIGVEVEGYIGDSAYTIDFSGDHGKLVEAAEEALKDALCTIKPGKTVGEVGGVIEDKIKGYGFRPVSNLSGHMIKQWNLHAGIDIPNIRTEDNYQFIEGDVFAVEPFATTGKGVVSDTDKVGIFSLQYPGNIRYREGKRIIEYIMKNYGTMPFAERWLVKEFKRKLLVTASLREMVENRIIKPHPILKEVENGLVAQAEHTILVEKDGVVILTE